MAKNSRKKVKAKAKAKPHVQARRTARVVKKQAKAKVKAPAPTRRTVTHEAVTTELSTAGAVNAAVGGQPVEAIAESPATDSGVSPAEEKDMLNTLDEGESRNGMRVDFDEDSDDDENVREDRDD